MKKISEVNMKNLYLNEINKYRINFRGHLGNEKCGFFIIPYKNNCYKNIISSYNNWEHLSTSIVDVNRTPTWDEMCYFKDFFFNEEECLIQYHPAKKDYVNTHPYVLHMWKPIDEEIKMPPKYMV
jgi:hypothetical protein